MSFDLYFCWRKHERIDFELVKAWAAGFEGFAGKENQLWYSNSKTGVYFSLDFDPENSESPADAPSIPHGYYDSGLRFNLNFNRPSYFGYEAMPFVEQVAERFSLSVVDPQADGDEPELITAVDGESLIRSWVDHNRRAILALIQDPEFSAPLQMALTSSLYLWKYMKAKEDLETTCGEEIFVPNLVPVRRKRSTKVGRAVTCTQGVPMIVPESEWVFIVRGGKRFFRPRDKHEAAVISAETFRELLVGYIKPFQWSDPAVQVIGAESIERVGKIIQSIDHILPRAELEIIGTDSFVDIELPDN
jgi:hypothetical protein